MFSARFLTMLNLLVTKHGGSLRAINPEESIIDVECPEETQDICAYEIHQLLNAFNMLDGDD